MLTYIIILIQVDSKCFVFSPKEGAVVRCNAMALPKQFFFVVVVLFNQSLHFGVSLSVTGSVSFSSTTDSAKSDCQKCQRWDSSLYHRPLATKKNTKNQ